MYACFDLGDESMKRDKVDKLRLLDEFAVGEESSYESNLYEIYSK